MPITRSVQIAHLAYATAFSQVSLFLASFWSIFPAKIEAPFRICAHPYYDNDEEKKWKLSKHQKYYFLVSDFCWMIVNIRGKIDPKINWSVKTPLHGQKGVTSLRVMGSWFSFKNADISIRLGLLSTLLRWAFSSETHRFENALESGSKRDRISIVSVWMDQNASKWIWWPKISPARVLSMRMKFNLCHTSSSIVFERLSV